MTTPASDFQRTLPDQSISRGKRKYHTRRSLPGIKTTTVATGVQPPTCPPQIPHVAYNIHGWAMSDPMAGRRDTYEVINARKATMIRGGFAAKVEEMQYKNTESVYRDDLTYTNRELDSTLPAKDASVMPYLVVGYTLREDDPVFTNNKTFERYSEGEIVGETLPSDYHYIDHRGCQTPILVVTPVKENTGTSVRLFGLVLLRSGLCQPVLLTHARIFYRWEFRASAGAKADQRNKNWNQIVINKALQINASLGGDSHSSAPRVVKRRRASVSVPIKQEVDLDTISTMDTVEDYEWEDNTTNIILTLDHLFAPKDLSEDARMPSSHISVVTNLKINLTPDVKAVISHIRESKTDRVESELRKALLHLGLLRHESQFPALSTFPRHSFGFDEEMAARVAEELKHAFPRHSIFVGKKTILRVKTLLQMNAIEVEYPWLEEFFSRILPVADQPQITDATLVEFMRKAADDLSEYFGSSGIFGPCNQRSYYPSQDVVLVTYLMHELLKIHEWQAKTVSAIHNNAEGRPKSLTAQEFEHTVDIPHMTMEFRAQFSDMLSQINLAAYEREFCTADDVLLWGRRLFKIIKNAAGN